MSRDRFFRHQALGLLAGLGLLCSAPVAQATPETDLANCEYGIKAFFTKFYKYQEGAWTDILAKKNNAKATADQKAKLDALGTENGKLKKGGNDLQATYGTKYNAAKNNKDIPGMLKACQDTSSYMSTSANFVSVPTASNHKDSVAAIIIN